MCLISIVLVFGIFSIVIPNFIGAYSLQNMMIEAAPLLLMAGGLSFVIYTGASTWEPDQWYPVPV